MHLSARKPERRGPIARAERRLNNRQPRVAGLLATVFSALVLGLVGLAAMTDVPQVTRAPGTIVPQGDYTRIESLEGGIVEDVHVHDGDWVEAGALLVSLHHPSLAREHASLSEQLDAVETRLENAQAVFDALQSNQPIYQADVRRLQASGLNTAAADLDLFAESQQIRAVSIAQQEETVAILIGAEAFAQERVTRQQEQLAEQAGLFERGVIVRTTYQAEVNRTDTLRAAASDAAIRLAEAQNALAVARAERQQDRLHLSQEMLREIADNEQAAAELRASLATIERQLAGLRLTAPTSGIIQAVAFPHAGEVIEPGETVFELLPQTRHLIVEARLPNADIGHVGTEHRVQVSVDTFDVRRFGRVSGRLASVSPVPIVDPQTGVAYFRAAIELDSSHVGQGEFERSLRAGMTAVVEIKTDEQSLLSYLLKPVQLTLDRAFTER